VINWPYPRLGMTDYMQPIFGSPVVFKILGNKNFETTLSYLEMK
jgi:hypothetical protein